MLPYFTASLQPLYSLPGRHIHPVKTPIPWVLHFRLVSMLSHSVKSDCLWSQGLQSARLLYPWRFFRPRTLEWVAMPSSRGSSQPRDWTWVSHTESLYHLSHQGSPRMLEWVVYSFSRGSSRPKNWIGVSCIAGRFFTSWATRDVFRIAGPLSRSFSTRRRVSGGLPHNCSPVGLAEGCHWASLACRWLQSLKVESLSSSGSTLFALLTDRGVRQGYADHRGEEKDF